MARGLGQHQFHPAVLWNALLGDVQPGNDLDARGDLFLDRQRRRGDLAQDAVDTETDSVELLVWLEVDVGCPVIDRVEQHFLDEFDDRCVVDILAGGLVGLGGRRLHRESRD